MYARDSSCGYLLITRVDKTIREVQPVPHAHIILLDFGRSHVHIDVWIVDRLTFIDCRSKVRLSRISLKYPKNI
jgi:hypothetical protein